MRSTPLLALALLASCAQSMPRLDDGGAPSSDASLSLDAPAIDPALDPPRPIAPLSTATASSRTPTLRWALPPEADGARVEICRDRSCSSVLHAIDVVGSQLTLDDELPAGAVFWRLSSLVGSLRISARTSPTWELFVRARSAPRDTSAGSVLDVDGDAHADVVVGAEGVHDHAGRAYVYLGSDSSLSPRFDLELRGDDRPDTRFGHAIASAGDVNGDGFADLAIGSWGSGRVHVHHGSLDGLRATPDLVIASDESPDFGMAVAGAGDVNGDGYADLVVGAPSAESSRGRAYVYLGSAGGLSPTPATILTGPDDGYPAMFGCSVAGAGDLDGDSYADLVVGAYGELEYTGGAHVFYGGPRGIDARATTALAAPERGASFGLAVASAGDLDGDGLSDLVISAQGNHAGGPPHVHVWLGATTRLAPRPSITLGTPAWASFGWSVASAGDLDGDGYDDLVLGAPAADSYRGQAYVYLGSPLAIATTPSITLSGLTSNGRFGRSIASGDLDGDGLSDLVIGAEGSDSNRGTAHAFLGDERGVATAPSATLTGPAGAEGLFGISVAGPSR